MNTSEQALCVLGLCLGGGGSTSPDSGIAPDSGIEPDAGVPVDAGTETDAGTPPGPVDPGVGPDPTQCAAPIAPGRSDVLYVCDCQAGADTGCVAGDDANPGSAAAPIRTFAAGLGAINASSGGVTVALCRGGAWDSSNVEIGNQACSAANPCTIADYAPTGLSADAAVPLVRGSFGFMAQEGAPIGGFVVRNLQLVGPGSGAGIYAYRVVDDVDVSCVDISGFDFGFQNGSWGARVVVSDSYLHDNNVMGLLGTCDDCGIRRSSITDNGAASADQGVGAFAHNVYLSASNDTDAARAFVENCYIARASVQSSDGTCTGASLNVHGGLLTDLRIVGNVVEEPVGGAGGGCWGIAVDSAGSNYEENRNALVANNIVRNVGNVGIGLASCVDCTVENNVVVQEFRYATGISVPNRPRSSEDAATTGVVVRNNTVYFGSTGTGIGVAVGGEGTNHVVTNNIVAFQAGSSGTCFSFDLPASAYDLVAANLCQGGPFDEGTTGMDSAAIQADPRFVAAPDDLRLQDGSPAIDSGTPASASSAGLGGTARDGAPDRGAYER